MMKKKINLDGSNGFRHYWYDLRKDKHFLSKRQFEGCFVMMWADFTANGTTPTMSILVRLNLESYIDMLAENLLSEAPLFAAGDYLFQQNNARCHVSCASRSWFEANSLKLLHCPAKSPNLNFIENLLGILAGEAYSRQQNNSST